VHYPITKNKTNKKHCWFPSCYFFHIFLWQK